MGLLARMRSFCRNALHRSNMERDMSDELQFHLAARVNDLVERRGVSSEEARRIARLEFGSQLASIDFFTVPTATFRVLFVFVVCRTTGGASST